MRHIRNVSHTSTTMDFLRNLPPADEPRYWQAPSGRLLAWNEYGDPVGRPLIYVHGWPSSRLQGRLVHHLARECGLRVLEESFREGVRQGGRGVMDDAEIYCHPWSLPLEEIQAPIRYWHGGHDRNISVEMVRAFSAHIPAARLDVDPEEGHFSLAIHRARDAMDHLAAA